MLAGLPPVAVLCEIVDDADGSMARLPKLRVFAERENLKIISIADLIRYRRKKDRLIERASIACLPLKWGNVHAYCYKSVIDGIEHIAMVKMDKASILGDAIEYLEELLQKINDLQNEVESSPSTASLPPTPTSFHPLTLTLPTLPFRVKEELCPSALPSPTSQQPRVEVKMREGQAVNIHMLCARRPGLLLSAMKAIEDLGLNVQQAVISCFQWILHGHLQG